MECVAGALKSSFRKEMGLKSSAQQALLDDLWVVNAQNVASCDDFFVDDLLDLSNEDAFVEKETDRVDEHEDKPDTKKLEQQPQEQQGAEQKKEEENINFSEKEDFGTVPTAELSVPAEDLANLEWLSHFVDESYSTTPFLAGGATAEKPMMMIEVVHPKQEPVETPFQSPVPAKARSKRCRSGGRVWSLGSPSLTESSSSSTTSSSSCSSQTQSSPWLIYAHPSPNPNPYPAFTVPTRTAAPKKPRKARFEAVGQAPRRCSHCGVQKTPQWRTGPHGTKTLCNACGVRFKSGRLLPEYRPACSPNFSSDLHSNHHRKVLEMRRKKETLPRPEPTLGHQVVSSF